MRSFITAGLSLNPRHLLESFGTFATVALVAIIFAESGLLIGFFLPGDSLLFTAGLLSGTGLLPPFPILVVLVFAAAVAGDQVGYVLGRRVGPSLFRRPDSRIFKQEYVDRSQDFFDHHGSKTIIIARFVPIVRTFAPMIAGVSRMKYRTFVIYNIVGGFLWAVGVTTLGWALGSRFPAIGDHLEVAILAIIALSLIPVGIEVMRHRRKAALAAAERDGVVQAADEVA